MKVCLIDPPLPYSSPPLAPLILEYLGGLTKHAMPDADIELLDPKFHPFSVDKVKADVVGICGSRIVTLPWVYNTADTLRKRGTQVVLGGGTPAEVRDNVRRSIEALAPGGGFIFAAVHDIQADVPPENIMAMWEAWREHGTCG